MVLQPPTAHYTTTHHYYTLQRTINTNNHSATHDGARSDDNRPNADSMTARQHDSTTAAEETRNNIQPPQPSAQRRLSREEWEEREMEAGGQANRQEHTSEWLSSASASVHAYTPKRKRKNTRKRGDADVPRSGNTNALGRSSERNVLAPDRPIERAASCPQRGVVAAGAIQQL